MANHSNDAETGFPELTALGKRIEMLRIQRGLSKQRLARLAGASRQQLWRVATGKSELTTSLCARLAEALDTDPRLLRASHSPVGNMRLYTTAAAQDPASKTALATFVASRDSVAASLRALPPGPVGDLLRAAIRDALILAAAEARLVVPDDVRALLTPAAA